MEEKRYRGTLERARVEEAVFGEAPTKQALSMEKARTERNCIDKIECAGVIADDEQHMKQAFGECCQALFSLHDGDMDTFKDKFLGAMPRIHDEQKQRLDAPISEFEVQKAVENLNSGISPVQYGLSAAFYKAFKEDISPVLTALFNDPYELKALPPSFGLSQTVLIPKTEYTIKLRQAYFTYERGPQNIYEAARKTVTNGNECNSRC